MRRLELVKQRPGVMSALEFAAIEATNNRRAVAYLRRVLSDVARRQFGCIHSRESIAMIEAGIKATEPRKLAGHTKRRGPR